MIGAPMKQWLTTALRKLKEYYIRPRLIALVYALTAFILLLALWFYVGSLAEKRLLLDERAQVADRVNTIGTSLTLAVNQKLMLITSVRSYMEAETKRWNDFSFDNPDDLNEVSKFITGLYDNNAGIRNVAIAPNNVMKFVYPYEENKAVLGYDPTQDERPYVREEIQRAIQTKGIVLSPPYELIQGGQGVIARQAIYVDGRYWGLANVVLDVPTLLEEAGIYPMPTDLKLAIMDQSGIVFFGSDVLFTKGPVVYEVKLPEGVWKIAAIPVAGWGIRFRSLVWFYRVLGLIGTITIPLLIYQVTNRRERLAHLVDRRTQELSLSNQTLITVLEGIDADVYVADFETYEILFANKHLRGSFRDDLVGKICYEVFRNGSGVCADCKNNMLRDVSGTPTGVFLWESRNPITGRWYKNADRAIRWNDGRYVHLQIATDISEQKEDKERLEALLREKDILLAEVHHRVKNNMQVIISLLGLQASEIEDEQLRVVYEESRNCIKSMSLVHEQLYHSKEYARIDFVTYVDQLATTLFNTYSVEPERI
jgi:sensor domain CHASE-containing protein